MELNDLTKSMGEWLRGAGPESDIVISSRIRLARNLADFPFITKATDQDREQIEKLIRGALGGCPETAGLLYVDLNRTEGLDRQLLVERHLISRELAEGQGARAVAIENGESYSVMINEEDHLRIQVLQSGFDLQSVWEKISHVDDLIEEKVTYAFHDRWGYLTACPTNVGTGLRVSVMLHLPALVMTRQIEKVFRSLQKISHAVRGLYGEGSQALGDFYQISNQITLGRSEEELIEQLRAVVPAIVEYERKARSHLMAERLQYLHDQVSRAYGILRTAQTISSEETMALLSSVRMGVNLGLIGDLPIPSVNELFIRTQPAHLQKFTGGQLEPSDRNIERARFLRRYLNREIPPATTDKN